MSTKLQKWGNSQGVRLPKEVLEKAGVTELENVVFEVETHGSRISLVPKTERSPLEKLFEDYDHNHPRIEYEWDDEPVGKEFW